MLNLSLGQMGAVFLGAMLVPSSLFAQKPAAWGTVTGHVTCADTNAPARLASVVLRPVEGQKFTQLGSKNPIEQVHATQVHSGLDGAFVVTGVVPGTYYVFASASGYISALTALGIRSEALFKPDDELKKRIHDHIPTVTVEANATATVNISLERGASVSGTILYDDGSPATGIQVHLVQHKKDKWDRVETSAIGSMNNPPFTDDRGAFRIAGLPQLKDILLVAEINAGNSNMYISSSSWSTYSLPGHTISIFSGGAFREKDAKPFSLTAGEDRSGEDITLPLAKFHKVQGVVIAHRDGHPVNYGHVALLFADDKTELSRMEVDKQDGSFAFDFVPEGDYILKAEGAGDAHFEENASPGGMGPPTIIPQVTRGYADTEIRIGVDVDRSGITIDVADKPLAKPIAPQ